MTVVAHLTSVHSPADPRIARKECAALAAAGYDVVLVAPYDGTTPPPGVRLVTVPAPGGRLRRMTVTAAQIVRAALRERPAVLHIHDPELLPWATALRLAGRRVVYDVHEDNVTFLRQKRWLPRPLRGVLSVVWDRLERLLARPLTVVLAERYYAERFPAGRLVLNYPAADAGAPAPHGPAGDPSSRHLLYTGNVTVDRGALNHAALLAHCPEYELTAVGRTFPDVAAQMRAVAGPAASRLHLVGEGRYVPYEEIRGAYERGGWLAGLALFPETPHYARKELTKFFEYMQAGLPIVCSDLPAWRALVADQGVGLCVPPGDPAAAATALRWLREHPEEAAAMGQRGMRLAGERYTWASQAESLRGVYAELLHR